MVTLDAPGLQFFHLRLNCVPCILKNGEWNEGLKNSQTWNLAHFQD